MQIYSQLSNLQNWRGKGFVEKRCLFEHCRERNNYVCVTDDKTTPWSLTERPLTPVICSYRYKCDAKYFGIESRIKNTKSVHDPNFNWTQVQCKKWNKIKE